MNRRGFVLGGMAAILATACAPAIARLPVMAVRPLGERALWTPFETWWAVDPATDPAGTFSLHTINGIVASMQKAQREYNEQLSRVLSEANWRRIF